MQINRFPHRGGGASKTCFRNKSLVLATLLAIAIILISGFNGHCSSGNALIEEINIQKLVNGFDRNLIKQGNIVYDPVRNKLYVSGGLGAPVLAIINPETDTVEDIIHIDARGGMMALNASGELYIANFGEGPFIGVKWNPDTKGVQTVRDAHEAQQAMDSPQYGIGRPRSWDGYSLTGKSTWDRQRYQGYPPTADQDLNAVYNRIELTYNGAEKGELIHGPDTMFFDVAKNGKVYASNTGDCSISVFDLKRLAGGNSLGKDPGWVKDIHLGITIDEILLDSSGNIYIRNRLGGSTIYKYNQSTKRVALVADNENNLSKKQAIWKSTGWHGGGISMWPTGFALSPDGRELYVLSHYNACIDIIDPATSRLLSKIEFPVPWKPRTDSISAITMDQAGHRMFAVWPELGLVGVADLSNRRVIKMIDLSQFGFDRTRALNKGFGLVKLAYNSKNNKLYIYLSGEKKLLMLDGKTFQKERETNIRGELNRVNCNLINNDEKSEIYLGNQIFDSLQFTPKGYLTPYQLEIIGFNNSDNSIYADEVSHDRGLFGNTMYKFVGGRMTGKLSTGSQAIIPAKYYFDFPHNTAYVYFMGEARIKKYDLSRMQG